jgi:phosphatidylglycerol:prolipoprotein diacylglycerol transferase
MVPTLLIGPIALPTYPFFLLIAYWIGLWFSAYRAKQLALESDHIYNAGLIGLLAGIIGARLWFVLSHWQNYVPDLTQAFSLTRSALSAGEGLVIACLVVLIYLQRNKVPINTFLDAVAPGLALAIAIANVGAFLGGEWLGAPSSVPWAVEIVETARHPIQIYEAVASLLILGILLWGARYRPWAGFHFWLFVALYGISRLALEIFRARPSLIGDGFLVGQLFSLGAVVLALVVMAYRFKSNLTEAGSTTV